MKKKEDIFHREHIHMHKTFALKLILLINQGYLDVIHRHCHADTYTDNSFDKDNYQQDGPTVSESDESTPTAVVQPAVSSTRPCLYACVRVYLQLSYQLSLLL